MYNRKMSEEVGDAQEDKTMISSMSLSFLLGLGSVGIGFTLSSN